MEPFSLSSYLSSERSVGLLPTDLPAFRRLDLEQETLRAVLGGVQYSEDLALRGPPKWLSVVEFFVRA